MPIKRQKLAALALCVIFGVAAAPAWSQQTPPALEPMQTLQRLSERARANPGDAAQIVPLIVTLARNADPEVRRHAVDDLTHIARRHSANPPVAFSALATMINDDDRSVKLEVIRGLTFIADHHDALKPEALTLLGMIATAPDADSFIQANALIMLTSLPGNDAALVAQVRDILIPLLSDPAPATRAAAAQSMWAAHTGLPRAERTPAVDALQPLKNDPDADVRADADRYIRLISCDKPNFNDCLRP